MGTVVFIIATILAVMFMRSKRSNAVGIEPIKDSLTKDEKITVWSLCLLSPLVAGAIFYYGWKKKLPKKSIEANTISWYAFGIMVLAMILVNSFLSH